jgi:hypothetical protein
MKTALTIILVLGLLYVGKSFFYYSKEKIESVDKANAPKQADAGPQNNPLGLPGLVYELEGPLQTATSQGGAALGRWIKANRSRIQDPRLAWIELDYAVMISISNPTEARSVYQSVKQRTPSNSPIAPRLKQMQKAYE